MIRRVDDYLKDVARDNNGGLAEAEFDWGVLAIVKHADSVCRERGYYSRLRVAALREIFHMTELAGAGLTMSIHPKRQDTLFSTEVPKDERISFPIPAGVVNKLHRLSDFVRAHEADGRRLKEFVSLGLFQPTITRFYRECGWNLLE